MATHSGPDAEPVRLQVASLGRLRAGLAAVGARRFVEEVAFGDGAWERLPSRVQKTIIANTATFIKLSAGAGYDYLTRQVAAFDATTRGQVGLAS